MCHFLAPAGQPEMMHKNFMRRHLRISVARCSGMKFFAHFQLNTPQIKPLVSQTGLQYAHPTVECTAFNKWYVFLHDFVAHGYASFDW